MKPETKFKLKMLYLLWEELNNANKVIVEKDNISIHIDRKSMTPIVHGKVKKFKTDIRCDKKL